MGLIFNRKSSLNDKKTFSSTIYKKRVADSDINKRDIRKISKEMGFTRSGAKKKFEKILTKDQRGGLTREEVHDGFQKMILEGKITKRQAMAMMKKAGVGSGASKSLRYFRDISEWNAARKKEEAPKVGKEKIQPIESKIEKQKTETEIKVAVPENNVIPFRKDPALEKFLDSQKNPVSEEGTSGNQKNDARPKNVWDILNKNKAA